MRKLSEINRYLESQVEYYESNTDYSDLYLDFIGDTLQYEDQYSEEDQYKILDSDLTTSTDYSYLSDDAVAVYPVGEIEVCINTDLTEKEYRAIEDKLDHVSKYYANEHNNAPYIVVYICAGMNIRVYSDVEIKEGA